LVIRLLSLSLFLFATVASAAGVGVQVDLNPIVPLGKKPTLNVVIKDRLKSIEVTLTRSDGKIIKRKHKRPRRGTRVRFALDQPQGTQHYTGELKVNFVNGFTGKIPLEFDATVQGPLKIVVGSNDLDTKKRRLKLKVSRPCVRVAYTIIGVSGQRLAREEELFETPRPANEKFEVPLLGKPGAILKISLTAFDEQGFFQSIDLFPWKVEIPHDDVIFQSGKADILKAERPKLDAAIKLIRPQVKVAKRWAPVKLYVIGHTDTVGDSASNRGLSLRRARAIAKYLKRRGRLGIPVRIAGVGEDRLKLETPDETDAAQNRRAEYYLAIQPPLSGVAWH
jgi:outer membrane protein OmpA-like peptidoglycan-associated protein